MFEAKIGDLVHDLTELRIDDNTPKEKQQKSSIENHSLTWYNSPEDTKTGFQEGLDSMLRDGVIDRKDAVEYHALCNEIEQTHGQCKKEKQNLLSNILEKELNNEGICINSDKDYAFVLQIAQRSYGQELLPYIDADYGDYTAYLEDGKIILEENNLVSHTSRSLSRLWGKMFS